ncbi:MAG TPA: pseudouridine synthase [Candidatus Saccharimonadales bacterium]|nr:pseudouridine synthase [Candidatus Saccharimonadales bacterium]
MRNRKQAQPGGGAGTGLARVLSKLGYCSRSQAWDLIQAGRVAVNGAVIRDAEHRTNLGRDKIQVDGVEVRDKAKVYLMLNKPRGLVTTASDEQGRGTVYECLGTKDFISPVGRLDKASEGLLLFTNDTAWAARITDPASHLDKTYHVQVNSVVNEALTRDMVAGIQTDEGLLKAKAVRVLRHGEKNSWLEVVLDEGKNRQIRRLVEGLGIEVLRLVRISIGPLSLGNLAKGQKRPLTQEEVAALAKTI